MINQESSAGKNLILNIGLAWTFALSSAQLVNAETEKTKADENSTTPAGGTVDTHDWQRFNPYKFQPSNKLVPSPSAVDKPSNIFQSSPLFPHDPTKSNIIFGRGTKSLPTEIYAKAYDVLQIGGKYYQAPGAGGSKIVVVDGESVTIYGTTVYTPLRDNRYVGNPGQVSPFDPTKIFYKDQNMWPSVIYGEPGKDVMIAGKKITVPAAGQVVILKVGKDGQLKLPSDASPGTAKANSTSDTASGGKSSSSSTGASSSGSSNGSTSSSSSAASKTSSTSPSGTGASSSGGSSSNSGTTGAGNSATANSGGTGTKDASTTSANLNAERAAAEKAAAEKSAAEKAASEKAASEKAAAEKAEAERAAAEKAAAEKAAAERVAAEKAAAEKAAAEKAAAEKAAAEKDAADKAAAEKALAEAIANMQTDMSLDKVAEKLAGEWGLVNTSTALTAKLKIQATGTSIEGIITDQGSGYIPAGKTRFSGNITGNPFQVTVLRAYPGFTDPYNEGGSLAVTSANDIKITAPTGNLILKRLSAFTPQQPSDSQSSGTQSQSSSSSSQQSGQSTGNGTSTSGSNSSQGTQSDIGCL